MSTNGHADGSSSSHLVKRTTTFQEDNSSSPRATDATSPPPPRRTSTRALSSSSNISGRPRMSIGGITRAISHTFSSNMIPEKKIGEAPSTIQSFKAAIFHSWLNVLLLCIPVSWALHFVLAGGSNTDETIIFIFSFISIIPLAGLLAFATDQLSLRVGQTLAGLLNATLGNAVELIVSIIALVKCDLQVVQSSLVGSILSNILLVLGMCFFAGGLRYSEQGFGISSVQLNASLLIVSVIAVLLPATFHFLVNGSSGDAIEAGWILKVSHGTALILLFLYAMYLVFQLSSHKQLYDTDHGDASAPKTIRYAVNEKGSLKTRFVAGARGIGAVPMTGILRYKHRHDEPEPSPPVDEESAIRTTEPDSTIPEQEEQEEEEEERPEMSLIVTLIVLVVDTVLVAVTAEFLVDSINGLVDTGNISKEFVGLILLPIVGNAAEHVTAVTSSVKDKLTLSLGVAVGSSIQIALFVIPFIVTLAWIMGKPLTFLFDPMESVALFLSVLVVNYTTQDGKSNWLEGVILMSLYLILAVMFWFYPGVDVSGSLGLRC